MKKFIANILVVVAASLFAAIARGDHRIADICRIKGQEENILHGFGLVMGVKGTGDTEMMATQRALAHYMEVLGHHMGKGQTGLGDRHWVGATWPSLQRSPPWLYGLVEFCIGPAASEGKDSFLPSAESVLNAD